jgi:hypothetical protein
MTMRLAALALGAALTLPVAAHHSVVQYDLSAAARKTVTGTVKKFEWQNPHSWIWMQVAQGGAAAVAWGMELSSPGALRRSGFAWDSVKVGEKITVEYAPIKDGRNAGLLVKLTYEDGRVWQPTGQASPLPPPGRDAPGAAPAPAPAPEAPADAK